MWTNDLVRICKHGEPDMKGIVVEQGIAAVHGNAYKVRANVALINSDPDGCYIEMLFYMKNALGTKRYYSVENKEVWMENL